MYVGLGQAPITFPTREAFTNMTSAQIDAVAAKLPAAKRAELIQAGLQAMPTCWGIRSESCAASATGPFWDEPRCSALMYGFFGDRKRMDEAVEQTPMCDELAPRKAALLAGFVGLSVGLLIGVIVS